MNIEIICTICLDLLFIKKSIKTKCGHFYHYDCIIKWIETKNNCPQCRTHTLQKDCEFISKFEFISTFFENGLFINDIYLFPKNLLDLKLCFLYLFYRQHVIFIMPFSKPLENKLHKIVDIFLQNVLFEKVWFFTFINFYKQKDLVIRIRPSEDHFKIKISMNEIRRLFTSTLLNHLLL